MKWKSKGYALDPEQKAALVADAAEKLQALGYLFYAGPRDLGKLAPPVEIANTNNTGGNSGDDNQ